MSDPQLAKTYDPGAIEQSIYQRWEELQSFGIPMDGKAPYCIMIPPPNVTGSLHMGHGFQEAIMDALIRYKAAQVSQWLLPFVKGRAPRDAENLAVRQAFELIADACEASPLRLAQPQFWTSMSSHICAERSFVARR